MQSYLSSQANQDLFCLFCLGGKKNGTFLEIGCGHPFVNSNTHVLESCFGWNGISIDIDPQLTDLHRQVRKSTVLCADATTFDYNNLLSNFDKMDYLSIDLEPASRTLQALQSLPLQRVTFSVITYEHDLYRFGTTYKTPAVELLQKHGYVLVCENVKHMNSIFEDWWIHPSQVDEHLTSQIACKDMEHSMIVRAMMCILLQRS